MMKFYSTIFLILLSASISAQNIRAEYISVFNLKMSKAQKDKLKKEDKNLEEKYIDNAAELFDQSDGKTAKYVLTVKDGASSYILQPNEYAGSGVNFSYEIAKRAEGDFYSDLAKGETIQQTEFQGNIFLVLSTKKDVVWNITEEKKKIGTYECIKATAQIKVVESGKKIGEREIDVWFTPSIPTTAGPMVFSGLPGLPVYITDNKIKHIYLDSIELNPENLNPVVFPKKGKSITGADFLEHQRKNL